MPPLGCVSLLPALEPLLGIGFALNLAYLNLSMFHFLESISSGVASKMRGLENGTVDEVRNTDWYKHAAQVSKICEYSFYDFDETRPHWIGFKNKLSEFLFNILFYYKLGKAGSILSVVLTAFFVILGVSVSVGATHPWLCWLIGAVGVPLSLSVVMFLWPVICISAGAFVNHTTQKDLSYNLKNLGRRKIDDAIQAVGAVSAAINKH